MQKNNKSSPRAPIKITTSTKVPISQSKISPRSPTEKKPNMANSRKSPLRSAKAAGATSPIRNAHTTQPS